MTFLAGFLSFLLKMFLQGNKGRQGDIIPGPAGRPGFPGQKGRTGLFGMLGAKGEGGIDGPVGQNGLKGEPGFAGNYIKNK